MNSKNNKITKKERKFITAILMLITVLSLLSLIMYCTGIIKFENINNNTDKNNNFEDNQKNTVNFIDVGQGDCTLIISDSKIMLVDCGEPDNENKVINYLQNTLHIEKLDYVVVTHPHSDHMGEMSDIIDNFQIDNFIMPKIPDDLVPTSTLYKKMITKLSKNHIKKTNIAKNESFKLGDFSVNIYTPKKEHSNLNNYSLLIKLEYQNNSFLLTGDCEKEEEKDFLEQDINLSADVLKVGHHGSPNSCSKDFLEKIKPEYAVISCGENNTYGHPSEKTLERLKKYTQKIFITYETGNIVFSFENDKININTNKKMLGD